MGTCHGGISRDVVRTPHHFDRGGSTRTAAGTSCTEGCEKDGRKICLHLGEALARRTLADRQALEVNHRLVIVLQMVVASLGRQSRMLADPAIREEAEKLAARVHAAAAPHRLMPPPRQPTLVNLGELLKEMALAFTGVIGLVCEADIEPFDMPGQVAMVLATAVNEVAWNACKHAYHDATSGVVQIICRHDADGGLRLTVADRGGGLPTDFDPCKSGSIGLIGISETVRQLGGELRVVSDQGARFNCSCLCRSVEGRVS